ncbi:MAG: hypothetical protein PHV18_05850 [Lachnospiraceae bacterium]|nr:hypothetical protein [Lachnospiraceae bacterium]
MDIVTNAKAMEVHNSIVFDGSWRGALAATALERYAGMMQRKPGLIPKRPEQAKVVKTVPAVDGKTGTSGADTSAPGDGIFEPDMPAQLQMVFGKMENPLELMLYLDDRTVSSELKAYITELCSLTDKLTWSEEKDTGGVECPCVKICRKDGSASELAFHGVPGGHEFTSFVLGLYNESSVPCMVINHDKVVFGKKNVEQVLSLL